MEGLGFASSTILRVKTDLGPALSTISPDDLLEFLVTGEKTVPVDMITDDDSEEVVADTRDTGDFWSDVMGSGPNRVVQEKKRSFHFRVAPFLDLFCYAGGDEYGSLPTVLPYLRLSIVKCIIASADVASLGFKGVEDAFATMKAHGIVTLHNDLAQLTALGFRYHFPFHNEENMLEVQIRRNASAVKDLLARRKAEGEARAVEYEEGELHLHNDSEDEDDEEEESEYSSDDQVLPELKFGI
ncbi:hypothetical protein AGDE_14339 [Angomonas deanei]|uniref:Uncharacterized protein n=1 Tax=Angomonas deanei TaxID=59799 RepID=A0A7G2CDY8_9TRYP|nr:hypothetical protein AGDE_14339 [Angomonas deanei]CAD2218046.1 hypothetical protein, conserved [Angomonas deanei]|eukprot:EPY21021.1 hypothetical protein AGDE_14339 [Angomonas deanei]